MADVLAVLVLSFCWSLTCTGASENAKHNLKSFPPSCYVHKADLAIAM